MSASAGREVCGKWMPRARARCGRKPLHRGDCRTPESLNDHRLPLTGRRVGVRLNDDPVVRARWNRTYRRMLCVAQAYRESPPARLLALELA